MRLAARIKANGIWLIVLVYVVANAILLGRTVGTFDELRTFSMDEPKICEQAQNLISARSFVPYDSTREDGGPQSCNPYPYGQLYLLAISGPLILAQAVVPVVESTIIKWAIVVLVVSGVVTLVMTYRIGARLYGHLYGLVAALLLVSTSEFVRWSHEIHPDLPQLALLMTGFYFAVRLYERGTEPGRRWMIDLSLASFCAGAAMATKFNGVFLLPVIALACNAPFLSRAKRFTWREALKRNSAGGALCVAAFAGAALLFSPCFVLHPNLFLDPIERATAIATTQISRPEGLAERLSGLLHSNRTLANHALGHAGYVLALGGLLIGAWRVFTRSSAELKRPRILAEVLVLIVLVYSLGFGYGLYGGALLSGYERYVLPAIPLAYVSGMRFLRAAVRRSSGSSWAIVLFAGLVLLGQYTLLSTALWQYKSFYLAKETGFYRAHDWVLQHIPRRSKIYSETYIRLPQKGYAVTLHRFVHDAQTINANDYIITKTLEYQVFRKPDRWQRYSGDMAVVAAKRLYELLERGRPRTLIKVAELSAGDALGRTDAVVIYKKITSPFPPAR